MSITKTIELDKFCKSILNADRNVRSVAVLDKKGIVLHNIFHPRFMQPSLEKWNYIHYMECMFDISMGQSLMNYTDPLGIIIQIKIIS